MECKVCLDTYDDQEKRPRNLPCGHTFCSECINDLIKEGRLSCPNCRKGHSCYSANAFPYAYDLEDLISKMKTLICGKAKNADKIVKLQEEQMADIDKSFTNCTETYAQLESYRSSIIEWMGDHDICITELKDLIEVNSQVREQLKREVEAVTLYLQEGDNELQKLKLVKEQLSAAQMVEAVSSLDNAEVCTESAEVWVEKCQKLIPNGSIVYRSKKVRKATKKAVNMAIEEIGDISYSDVQVEDEGGAVSICLREVIGKQFDARSELRPTILEKVDNIVGVEQVTVEYLRELSSPVRMLIDAGRVYAVHYVEGRPRTARISLRNGFICLHHLQDGPPPDNAHILQHSELLRHVDKSSTLVFLEVSRPGASTFRVYIRLSPETERGRQFRLLCSGEHGPSYVNTRLLKVLNKGKPGECLRGGDYDKYDGTGGAALIVGLTRGGEYTRANSAGAVWGRWGDECRGAQFYITTRSRPAGVLLTVFGQVEIGLEALRLGINAMETMQVGITDCGIVVPHQQVAS